MNKKEIKSLYNSIYYYANKKPGDRKEDYKRNKIAILKTNKRWREKNKEAIKLQKIKKNYGLSEAEYKRLVRSSGGLCGICKNKSLTLCVDHCHATKRIRGLLCNSCNRAIGLLKDSASIIRAALEYLCR